MMMGFWLIVLLFLVGTFAYDWRSQTNPMWPAQTSQTPPEILKARYARGEITREEYEQLRQDIEG